MSVWSLIGPLVPIVGIACALWYGAVLRARRALAARRASWSRPIDRPRDFVAIAGYHRMRDATGARSVDDRTWLDLDMDDVFAHVDRTSSRLGQQVLYDRLRASPEGAHLLVFEQMVERFRGDHDRRERAQASLERLHDDAALHLWQLGQPEALPDEPWHVVFPIIAIVMALLLMMAAAWPVLLALVAAGTLLNLVIRVWTAPRVGGVLAAFRQLAPLIAAAETLKPLTKPAWAPLTGALDADTARLATLRTLARWAGRDTLPGDRLTQTIFAYLNLLFLIDANALYFAARHLRTHGETLLRVIQAVGEIDAAIAVASWRAGATGWSAPGFMPPGAPAVLEAVRHPLVRNAVPNSITFGPPRGLLVTGANMAGKSTFVRSVGVTTILAQTLHTCLAARYAAPIRVVRSALRVDDDLLTGRSYYLVEVETIVKLVAAARSGTPHLFLLDELFRGTNAVERVAAAEAVLATLVEARGGALPHVTIAATHDGELVHLLHASYETVHFADAIGPDGLVFDYRLRPGPTSTRNAIALLQLNGAPEALLARARASAAVLDARHDESRR
jgi:hypothetical protein